MLELPILTDILKTIAEMFWTVGQKRRKLRLTVHLAGFYGSPERFYFINATNLSKDREIEITHVWFDSNPQVHAIQRSSKLPKRLKPDEAWETWVPLRDLVEVPYRDALRLGRARLSTGAVVRSIPNVGIPEQGWVAGGPIKDGQE